ncbi:hypothetical protein [Alloactinosynnema sp. L-07]|uniref:PIN domain-containing protein n=1 Tax=Alloactinosynnema sp. L-07 TaxID=1653480 RepID=UPI00065EF955|nr:PIN domain-containing protein [Alloactinosynnema sp. L-07]CRK61681.1 hypothetical protein [Alloactinosynnema sp. L-07]
MTTSGPTTFVDTNVLVYAHDKGQGERSDIAESILRSLWESDTGIVSTQVLQEFYAEVTKKLNPPMPPAEARDLVIQYGPWCTQDTDLQLLVSASRLHQDHQVSWRDALIIEAALRSGASTLLTEDLHHGRIFGTLTVRDPFRPAR